MHKTANYFAQNAEALVKTKTTFAVNIALVLPKLT
jgi:hypothetical protein